MPFLCDFPRATTLTDDDPYAEIGRYLKAHRDHVDRVFRTLAYFDVAILGSRAAAPALFSVGLMDEICPPSTVYAAFNRYGGREGDPRSTRSTTTKAARASMTWPRCAGWPNDWPTDAVDSGG